MQKHGRNSKYKEVTAIAIITESIECPDWSYTKDTNTEDMSLCLNIL